MTLPLSSLAPHLLRALLIVCAIVCTPFASAQVEPDVEGNHHEPGLLFYLSANQGTTADYSAAGTPEATFASEVTAIQGAECGPALSLGDFQRLAWSAPGNIYAQRGTLSFLWRSRYPVGPTEFPIFRVAYADHSSWDMVWLRIDYNGHGFDAFVTDASLSRTRVSATLDPFPAPEEWVHIVFEWDETVGIRLYLNGKLAAEKLLDKPTRFDAALDQFGPHARIISPYAVQSAYSFTRGGDIDEIRIYDRRLSIGEIALMATHPDRERAPYIDLDGPAGDNRQIKALLYRHGFDNPDALPPELTDTKITIRKVEIHNAFDEKRWWWKANDGIRETTWPGVYNRSRLPGRNDYFQLPDWDCYSTSGKSITFHMPDEPWNHLEISGAAHGKMELLTMPANLRVGYNTASGETPPYDNSAAKITPLFERPQYQEHTAYHLVSPVSGPNKRIRFTNADQEEPIGELSAYYVHAGAEPDKAPKLEYQFSESAPAKTDQESIALAAFIKNRHTRLERTTLWATPTSASGENNRPTHPELKPALSLIHIVIPNDWDSRNDALDGIAIDLPALESYQMEPDRSLLPINIQVKDPLWPMRNMLDFSFSLRVENRRTSPRTLWLDLRDRILPQGKPIYLTVTTASAFTDSSFPNAKIRLVFKPRAEALTEHELDRFTQARDNYAMQVEEKPRGPKFALWTRFAADLKDLLRVNPRHALARQYAAAVKPALDPVEPPDVPPLPEPENGAPLWAVRQVQLLDHVSKFVNWYIDHRQIANGEFGGGISDDTDLTNTWPGLVLMGVDSEKIAASNLALLNAAYDNGMFTNGLNTIQTDELHVYEEGINALGECMVFASFSPQLLERAMETTRGLQSVTGINAAGHRHIRSTYYGANRIATERPWNAARPYSYLTLQPAHFLADYNGNPATRKFLLELTDGLLAHRARDADGKYTMAATIHFDDDSTSGNVHPYFPWPMFWNAWQWTGDQKYLDPIYDGGAIALANVNSNAIDILSLRNHLDAARLVTENDLAFSPPGEPKSNQRRALTGIQRGVTFDFMRWQLTGDMDILARSYTAQIRTCQLAEYINTEGSLWIDRVGVPTTELQRARLGGVGLARNSTFHGHAISWQFHAPATAQNLAILMPDAAPDSFTIIAYNLSDTPIRTTITGGPVINPGTWEITQRIDNNNSPAPLRTVAFARDVDADLTFAPRVTTTVTFRKTAAAKPYAERPDLGIELRDITQDNDSTLVVRVHSLGSVASPATTLALIDNDTGKVLASSPIPSIAAPLDLLPKTKDISLSIPKGTDLSKTQIVIDPENRLEEISRKNNSARLEKLDKK